VHRVLAERALQAAMAVCATVPGVRCELWFDGDAQHPWLADMCQRHPGLHARAQAGSDLGARMHHALAAGCADGADAADRDAAGAVLFGTDCPGLDARYLEGAVRALAGGADLVLGPVEDGGYVLVGLRRPMPELFEGVPWSTPAVLATTLAIAARHALTVVQLPMQWDVDVPADVPRLAQLGITGIELADPQEDAGAG
jgi:rSAM/selenodomain-associated transferase 1